MASNGTPYMFYHYHPSLPAAVIFIVLFVASTSMHSFQLGRRRTWYFIPFVIGGIFEVVGYIGRSISSTQSPNWTLGPYICQSLLLLLAPALFAASIYMILGRIIVLTDGESHSIVKVKWLTKLFVTGDVLSFLVQSSGGAMLATSKGNNEDMLGQWVITAGLFIQLIFFGSFIAVAGIFHYRITIFPSSRSQTLDVPWRRFLIILYAASGLIIIRAIFRVIHYIQGSDGFLERNEIFLYIFDAALMFTTMVLFNIWHPSRIIANKVLPGFYGDPESEESGHVMVESSLHIPVKSSK